MENREQEIRQDREDLIEGRNAVAEAIRAGRTIDKIFVARGDTDRTLARILAKARENGIVVTECDRRKLDSLSATGAHQGIIAQAAMREYASIEDILERAAERGEDPFIVVCDEIADPHNLGAILRTAECAGVHGVIIPKRRAAGLTAVVDKASAGAAEHMLVSRVTNIPAALGELKKKGLWVYGTAYLRRRTELYDGDIGLFETDGGIVFRQFCADSRGTVYLFAVNRAHAEDDRMIPPDKAAELVCYGRLELKKPIPLPMD